MNRLTKAEAFSLLGIALQLFGEPDSASKAFLISDTALISCVNELYFEDLQAFEQ